MELEVEFCYFLSEYLFKKWALGCIFISPFFLLSV